jgi:threonine dehydratase
MHSVDRLRRNDRNPTLPFDQPDVIAGQGTIGLELLEDFLEIGTIVVPVSGGGLISGIACAVKAASTSVRVIGVSMERGAAMHTSIAAGRPIELMEEAEPSRFRDWP